MLSLTMVAQATDSESFSLDPAGLRRPLKSLTGTFPHFVHYEPSGNSAMTETESDVAKEKGNIQCLFKFPFASFDFGSFGGIF